MRSPQTLSTVQFNRTWQTGLCLISQMQAGEKRCWCPERVSAPQKRLGALDRDPVLLPRWRATDGQDQPKAPRQGFDFRASSAN